MHRFIGVLTLGAACLAGMADRGVAACAPDAVQVGPLCVDKYEASAWKIPSTEPALVAAVRAGTVTSASQMVGAAQRGVGSDDYGTGCVDTAAGCIRVYAASIPGVWPSARLTWFQAAAACRNSGKRLLTNAEWQMAAFGTPDPGYEDDPGDCSVLFNAYGTTGFRSRCKSDVGAYDMIGNLWEWVADWGEGALGCEDWLGDVACFAGNGDTAAPQALVRGGYHGGIFNGGPAGLGLDAGVFALMTWPPNSSSSYIGFRCAR